MLTYLPLRAQNPKAHTSISLSIVATVANTFLSRAAYARGEPFFEWDADDVVGVCINLIDQVCQNAGKGVNGRDILRDKLLWRDEFWCCRRQNHLDLLGFRMLGPIQGLQGFRCTSNLRDELIYIVYRILKVGLRRFEKGGSQFPEGGLKSFSMCDQDAQPEQDSLAAQQNLSYF